MGKYENLQEREEAILLLRRHNHTYKIIGTIFEISSSRVSQIYHKALRRRRHNGYRRIVKDSL